MTKVERQTNKIIELIDLHGLEHIMYSLDLTDVEMCILATIELNKELLK